MNHWKGWVTAFILLNPFGIARSEEPAENPQKKPYRIEIMNVRISSQSTASGPLTNDQKQRRIRTLRETAMILFDRKDYRFALEVLNEILAIDKNDAQAIKYVALCQTLDADQNFEKGNQAMEREDFVNAEGFFGRALRRDPSNPKFQVAYSKVVGIFAEKEVKILTGLCGLSAQQQAQIRTIIAKGYDDNLKETFTMIQIGPEYMVQDEIKALLSPEQKVKYGERWKIGKIEKNKIPYPPPQKEPTRDSR